MRKKEMLERIIISGLTLSFIFGQGGMTVGEIIQAMDNNLNAKNRVLTSKMVVHGRRASRTIESKNWVVGTDSAFTVYLSPPREAGTKMLKVGNKLWTYSPQTDRVIQISGHMLRQSVMGSDMSYNDMMEDRPLVELYEATLEGSIEIDGRDHWIMLLEAKVKGLSYPKRRAWIDKEYLLPMKEELYAKSGKLLKTSTMDGIRKIQGRWFPSRFIFKDELKRNSKGTEWIIDEIEFDRDIPERRFSKALLRK
jgi:outer membrane lipoprotein-sorting protein